MGFAKNFNYCMAEGKYSAYRFAKIIGANNQTVINWQDGLNIPHKKTRQKIADHFGITLAELDGDKLPTLPEKGMKKALGQTVEGEIGELSAEEKELILVWRKMNQGDRARQLDYLLFLAKGSKDK